MSQKKNPRTRLLTGIQPSGSPHLGNYFGVMKKQIDYQNDQDLDCFFFIADLHALTTVRDPKKMRENSLNLVLDYLALGLDPNKVTFYRQSQIPHHTELTWILSTISPMGLLERAHAYKDATQKGLKDATVGLFTYPILMAADILLYSPEIVPVGQDQKQHIEIARDIAEKFNHTFGETFTIPNPEIDKKTAIVPGTNGLKMSKSYNNTIPIFAEPNELKKAVMSIETDSTPLEDPKDAEACLVYQIYKLLADKKAQASMKERLEAGNYGYGHAKTELFNLLESHFSEARQKRIELSKNLDYITEVLKIGEQKAEAVAEAKMVEVKAKIGLNL